MGASTALDDLEDLEEGLASTTVSLGSLAEGRTDALAGTAGGFTTGNFTAAFVSFLAAGWEAGVLFVLAGDFTGALTGGTPAAIAAGSVTMALAAFAVVRPSGLTGGAGWISGTFFAAGFVAFFAAGFLAECLEGDME